MRIACVNFASALFAYLRAALYLIFSIWDVFWVHTCHFALHVAGWVGLLTHHCYLSCGLHHTLQAHISTCHLQPHIAGCLAATRLHCPSMLRVCCCHPHLLHCQVCRCHPLYCSGCVASTLISCITGMFLLGAPM